MYAAKLSILFDLARFVVNKVRVSASVSGAIIPL